MEPSESIALAGQRAWLFRRELRGTIFGTSWHHWAPFLNRRCRLLRPEQRSSHLTPEVLAEGGDRGDCRCLVVQSQA